MKKLLLLLIIPFLSFGQNLIYNGGFEEYTDLPDDQGQLMNCIGWNNVNLVPGWAFEGKPYASPDYFHTESLISTNIGLPVNGAAYVEPYSGSAIAGFIAYAGGDMPVGPPAPPFAIDFREYISTQLTTNLTIGETYTLSLYLTNGEGGWTHGASCDHIGIHFSEYDLYQYDNEPINITPTLEIDGEVWNSDWQEYNFTFTADQNYQFLTIGNFYPDDYTTSTMQSSEVYSSGWSYYFIDNIELVNNSVASINDNKNINKLLLKTIDLLGRETNNNKGFQLHLYDDGTVDKKYLIK